MEWVVNATPLPLSPREWPGTHCIGGWLGPRASLNGCGKSHPHRDSIPGPSSPKRVAIPTALSLSTPGINNRSIKNLSQTFRFLQTLSGFSKGNGDVIDPVAPTLLFGIGLVIPTDTEARQKPLPQSTHHMKFYQNTRWMELVWEIMFRTFYAVTAIVNEY